MQNLFFNELFFSLLFPLFYLSPAHKLDGVNLQGYYLWRLQDRHVPQFGLFTSTQHQSKAKASITVYREIIAHSGFPNDDTIQTCRVSGLHECSICAWMFKNKAMLVFGGCLLITAVMLVGLVFFVLITKRNQTRSRSRRRRSRRRERVPVCSCPPLVKC